MSTDVRSASDEAPDAGASSLAPAARAGRDWSGAVFVTPFLAVFIVFLIYPLLAGLVLSLHKADLFGGSVFVALDNYLRLARDQVFLQAVGNTFYFVLLTAPALAAIGLALALALNRRTWWAAFFRGVFFPPPSFPSPSSR